MEIRAMGCRSLVFPSAEASVGWIITPNSWGTGPARLASWGIGTRELVNKRSMPTLRSAALCNPWVCFHATSIYIFSFWSHASSHLYVPFKNYWESLFKSSNFCPWPSLPPLPFCPRGLRLPVSAINKETCPDTIRVQTVLLAHICVPSN